MVTVSVTKERIDDRVGVTLLSTDHGAPIIHGIAPTSLFANTDLKVGMVVQYINDCKATEMSLKQAMKLLREAEDVVTIVASGGNQNAANQHPETPANGVSEVVIKSPPSSPGYHLNVSPETNGDSLLSAASLFCRAIFDEFGPMAVPAAASLRQKPKLKDFFKADLPHTRGRIDMRISFKPEWLPNSVGEQLSDIMKKEQPDNVILVGKSGCGKTSAIFHAAQESFCILLTASWEGHDEKLASRSDPGGFDESFSRLVADIKTVTTTGDDSKWKVEECERFILAFIVSRMLLLWTFQNSSRQPDKLSWLMYQLTKDHHNKAIVTFLSLRKKPKELLQNLKFMLGLSLDFFFFAFDEAQEGYKYLRDEHLWKSRTKEEYRGIACPIIRQLSGTGPLVVAGTAMSLVSIESCKSDIGKPENTGIIQEFPPVSLEEINERIDSLLNMEGVEGWQSLLLKLEGRGRLLGGFFSQLEKTTEEMSVEKSDVVFSAAIDEHYKICRDQIASRIRSGFGMSKQEEEEGGDKLLDRRGKKRLPQSLEILATAGLVGQTVSIRYKKIKVDLLNIGLCSVRMVGNQGHEFVLNEDLGRDAIVQVAHSEGYYSESLDTAERLCQSKSAVGYAMEPLIVDELRGWCAGHPNSTVRDFLSAACKTALPENLPSWIDEAPFSVVCGETKAGYLAKGIKDDVAFIEKAVMDVSCRNKLLSPSFVKRPDYEAVMGRDMSKDAWFLSVSSKLYASPLDDKSNSDFRSTKPSYFYTQANGKQNKNCKNLRTRWLNFKKAQNGLFRRCLRIHVCLPEVERPKDDPRRLLVDEDDGSVVLYITSQNVERVFSKECLAVLRKLGNLPDETTEDAEDMDAMDTTGDTGNMD